LYNIIVRNKYDEREVQSNGLNNFRNPLTYDFMEGTPMDTVA